jgi:sugar phosphate isomerase/epimerase
MLATGAAIGASRVAVAGDSDDLRLVAGKMAAICDLAGEFNIAVDLEFMPFRAVRNLDEAVEVVRRAERANAHILVDALHVFRSGSSLDALARLDRRWIGTLQLCDAPRMLPAGLDLVTEARARRLLPGAGELPLWALLDALPADIPLGVEVPMASLYPHLPPAERLARLASATRSFLEQRTSA